MRQFVRRLLFVALVVLAAGARPLLAQQAPAAAPAAASAAGPTLESSRVAARPLASAEANQLNAAAYRQSVGRPAALMLVGFGALLAGAIIGDDVGTIFMVGGAIIGLYGLYEFLK